MQEGQGNTQTRVNSQNNSTGDNVFLLKKALQTTMVGVSVDFSPYAKANCFGDRTESHVHGALPTFNKDHRYFTPAFILPQDTKKFNQNEQFCLANHVRKVKELEQQKTEMLLPKPSKANSFCQICKETFDDYLTHVTRPSHIEKMRASEFYEDIVTLCNRFNPIPKKSTQKKIKKERKRKQVVIKPVLAKKKSTGKSIDSFSTGMTFQSVPNSVTIQ